MCLHCVWANTHVYAVCVCVCARARAYARVYSKCGIVYLHVV